MTSDYPVDVFEFIVEGILLFVVGLMGLFGNSSAVVIFARQRVQRVFHHLLLQLAIFDAFYVVCSILLFALPLFIDEYTTTVKVLLLPFLLPVIHTAMVGSIYSTVILALERYLSVCHPLVRYRYSYKSRFFILPVCIFAVIYTLPKYFELRLKSVPVMASNTTDDMTMFDNSTTEYELEPTSLRTSKLYIRLYLIWMNLFVQIIIPFAILIILNYLIYKTIKKSEKNLRSIVRQKSSNGQNHAARQSIRSGDQHHLDVNGRNATLTLQGQQLTSDNKATSLRKREVTLSRISIYIAFVFLFCHSVRIVPNIYELVNTYTQKDLHFPPWINQFTSVSHLLITFASSVNFFIYYAKHGNCFGFFRRKDQQDHSLVTTRSPTAEAAGAHNTTRGHRGQARGHHDVVVVTESERLHDVIVVAEDQV